jgi:hypothetical protein
VEKVIIHVRGGVAEVVQSPEGLEVVIVDFDNEEAEDIATCAYCGKDFPESEVNMIDYDLDTCVTCENKSN